MSFLAERYSSFFRRQLHAGWIDGEKLQLWCENPLNRAVLTSLLSEHSLRQARNLVIMILMERDLQGRAGLGEVCQAMTDLAEMACQQCFQAAAREISARHGLPLDQKGRPQDLLIIAMGKAGAHELNVSSDLDLILVYRDQGETVSPSTLPAFDPAMTTDEGSSFRSISASEFFHQVARRAINELSEMRAEGFVFRIDTRLRPNGDSGPLVVSMSMLEQYFMVQGREWERFAWLKSRVIADTGIQSGLGLDATADRQELVSIVEPFVFRRYIDYRVFDGLKGLHQLIRQEGSKKDLKAPGTIDIKLGDGGIREIEFIAQMFQIVRGGRDPGLRNPATLTTLESLATRQLLPAGEAKALGEAYVFFRRIEHALQYVDDQQTHRIPALGEARTQLASMLGMHADGDTGFEAELERSRALVQNIFEALLRDPTQLPGKASADKPSAVDPAGAQPPETSDGISTGEPPLPERVTARLDIFREGARYKTASPETQQALSVLMQRAGNWLHRRHPADAAIAEQTFLRLIEFAEVVCRRPSYIALVVRFPQAFERVLDILSQSSWAANYLNKHPIVLDELLDGRVLEAPNLEHWHQQLRTELDIAGRPGKSDQGPDVERQMDLARELHHALVFKLLTQDLKGLWSVERLSDQLSEVADRCLQTAMDITWQQLPKRFRDTPRFAAIAYGKLGGKELGYASDMDLVFLHDDSDERAQEAYAQFAQKISSWLSTRTQAGILFEIDLRLRPNGNAGMLVTSLAGFERYQKEQAWTWELQALTRARFCAGDASIGERFEKIREQLICVPREPGKLREDVISMRQKMLDGHPNKTSLFDLKHDRGGMVDIEFMVQYLVLAHAHQFPGLARDLGNIALLAMCEKHQLIPAELGRMCQQAYRTYRRRQHSLRLNDQEYARLPFEGRGAGPQSGADALATVVRMRAGRQPSAAKAIWRQA